MTAPLSFENKPENAIAVLLCLGKYNQIPALEYWLAYHLALGMTPFICFSKDIENAESCRKILEIIALRYPIEFLKTSDEHSPPSEEIETLFLKQAQAKQCHLALRLALDEFFVPAFLPQNAETREISGFSALKIPYRHTKIGACDPQKILKFGLNPRDYYCKMTDGSFLADSEGRFLYNLTENPAIFSDKFRRAGILHDAAASSLSEEACVFFNQGKLDTPPQEENFKRKIDTIRAFFWQDILRHYLTLRKNLPEWLKLPPQSPKWYFLETAHDHVLAIEHKTGEICSVHRSGGTEASRLVLVTSAAEARTKEGWVCLFDSAPFPFLPLQNIRARAPALPVYLSTFKADYQVELAFTGEKISFEDPQYKKIKNTFRLLTVSEHHLPYPLAALNHLLSKGKEVSVVKNLLENFPAPPVTALWALMTRPDFFNAQGSLSLFSLLQALVTHKSPLALSPEKDSPPQ